MKSNLILLLLRLLDILEHEASVWTSHTLDFEMPRMAKTLDSLNGDDN